MCIISNVNALSKIPPHISLFQSQSYTLYQSYNCNDRQFTVIRARNRFTLRECENRMTDTTIIPVGKTTLNIDRQRRSSHHIDAAPATKTLPKGQTKKGVDVGLVERYCSRQKVNLKVAPAADTL